MTDPLASLYEEDAPDYSFILKIRLRIPLRNFGDLTTTIFMPASFLHLRIQPQPQAINRNATRNRRKPVGKITAIRIPAPSATAQAPSQRQFLISSPPCLLVYFIIYRGVTECAGELHSYVWN